MLAGLRRDDDSAAAVSDLAKVFLHREQHNMQLLFPQARMVAATRASAAIAEKDGWRRQRIGIAAGATGIARE